MCAFSYHILFGFCVDSHEVIAMMLPLEKDGQTVGTVRVDIQGQKVILVASCEENLDGIWRAYLTDGEQELLIGVMQPCEDIFFAKKQIFKSEIFQKMVERSHLFGKLKFDKMVRLCDLRWFRCETPPEKFFDDVLQTAVRRGNGVLVDSNRKVTRIAFPLDGECACAPALCLATVMEFSGKRYAVLAIDPNGNPMTFKDGR